MPTTPSISKQVQLTGHNAAIFSLQDMGDHFLSAAGDGWIAKWDIADPETGRLIARTERQIFSLQLLTDGRIVAGTLDGGLHWIDWQNTGESIDIAHHEKGVFGLQLTPNHLYSIGGAGLLTRWDLAKNRSIESLRLSNQSLRSIDYNPIRKELAIGASDNSIYLIDEPSFEIKQVKQAAHDNSIFTVKYHPQGDYLLSGGRDAFLRVWDLQDDQMICINAQPAHLATVNSIRFHPNGRWFATASRDKTVKIWETKDYRLRKVLDIIRDGGHRNSVNCIQWIEEGRKLLSAGDDRSIIIWDTADLS